MAPYKKLLLSSCTISSSFIICWLGLCFSESLADEASQLATKVEYFERHIRPVLVEHCYSCHSSEAKNVEAELLLDTANGLSTGGVTGPALRPGKPEQSLIIKALKHTDLQMPPDKRLSDEIIGKFEQWISEGAVDPRKEVTNPLPNRVKELDWNSAKDFWSFKPLQASSLPTVSNPEWVRNSVDFFVMEELDKRNMRPAPAADKATLLRRASMDLTGLPADYEVVAEFEQNQDPNAYSNAVERMLASDAFGERWARMWLDIARYAEDQAHIVGNDRSLCYPNAYLYRDWVIEAFNKDLSYDDFIRQQLAADLLHQDDLRPLGFLGIGPKYYNRGSPAVMADEWEDRVDVVTRGLLGLTVACARCHDHKYDPIPSSDYYALAGIFASTSMYNRPMKADAEKKDSGDAKKVEEAMHIVKDAVPTDLNVMIRGDVKRKGPRTPRGFLTVLSSDLNQQAPWVLADSSGRRELAESIVSPKNPLAVRVFVNRVWSALIGKPLVATASNFGKLGAEPTHPKLLDDLSIRFIQHGWSIKWLIREIVSSQTYQQSSLASEEQLREDPDNQWLARMNRKRLSVEGWRDAILARSGSLDYAQGGSSIDPQNPETHRRTLYSEISRLELNKMLALFDFPDPNTHAERRAITITALQKLFVLNSPFMLAQAKQLRQRFDTLPPETPTEERLRAMIRAAFAREADPSEIESYAHYLWQRTTSADPQNDKANAEAVARAWEEVAHVMLASNEMMYLD